MSKVRVHVHQNELAHAARFFSTLSLHFLVDPPISYPTPPKGHYATTQVQLALNNCCIMLKLFETPINLFNVSISFLSVDSRGVILKQFNHGQVFSELVFCIFGWSLRASSVSAAVACCVCLLCWHRAGGKHASWINWTEIWNFYLKFGALFPVTRWRSFLGLRAEEDGIVARSEFYCAF